MDTKPIREYNIKHLNTPFVFKIYHEKPTFEDAKDFAYINKYKVECYFRKELIHCFYTNVNSYDVVRGQLWALNKFLSERMIKK